MGGDVPDIGASEANALDGEVVEVLPHVQSKEEGHGAAFFGEESGWVGGWVGESALCVGREEGRNLSGDLDRWVGGWVGGWEETYRGSDP